MAFCLGGYFYGGIRVEVITEAIYALSQLSLQYQWHCKSNSLALYSHRELGAWASTWSVLSPDHRHYPSPCQQQRPKALTWFQATDICLAFLGSMDHRPQHKLLAAAEPWILRSASRAPIMALCSSTDRKHQHGGRLLSSTWPLWQHCAAFWKKKF